MAAATNYTDISGLIGAASTGGGIPSEELPPLVHDKLRHLATLTLQATALVHEAWLRLAEKTTDTP
jgi:hypothetical protein